MAALVPFIEPENPHIYYRVMCGHWHLVPKGPSSNDWTIDMRDPQGRLHSNYLRYNTPSDVFGTVYFVPTSPSMLAHLFFNTLARGHLRLVANTTEEITIMKIHTLQPLELAENYVRDVWWESDCGDLRQGPPTNSARLQGVSGREYVFDPSRLGRLEIAHYTSIDHPRIYTSPSYSAFIVGDDCIATNDPQYIPAPSPPAPGSPPNVRRNAAMEAALRARYPDNYLQVQVIQPRPGAPSWVYYHRILEDGSCSSPGRSS